MKIFWLRRLAFGRTSTAKNTTSSCDHGDSDTMDEVVALAALNYVKRRRRLLTHAGLTAILKGLENKNHSIACLFIEMLCDLASSCSAAFMALMRHPCTCKKNLHHSFLLRLPCSCNWRKNKSKSPIVKMIRAFLAKKGSHHCHDRGWLACFAKCMSGIVCIATFRPAAVQLLTAHVALHPLVHFAAPHPSIYVSIFISFFC
eukprot:c15528_g1_i1.p1 GENE.c15528_g1_i1~~c15528_g1_i1.p1  ORF type:complete len:202 (-),score=18.04 c15528_g1_i1:281-886(-)